jgi:hypothetical protein
MPPKKSIRLLGISVSGCGRPGEQDGDQLSLMLDGSGVHA